MRFKDEVDLAGLSRRLGVPNAIAVAEVLLAVLFAVLVARALWAVLAPGGPVGAPPPAATQSADAATLARFDPFFTAAGNAGPIVVSDLAIDLYGTRVDNVSGRGSAIMAADGGEQRSFAVGDEVMPGVTLHSVAFDSVTISRGGVLEQLFLDQSVPAEGIRLASPATAPEPAAQAATARVTPRVDAVRLDAELSMQPLVNGGRVSGARLGAASGGQLLNELGLREGDVLVSVNGVRVDDAARSKGLGELAGGAGTVVLEVRRGAELKTIEFEVAR